MKTVNVNFGRDSKKFKKSMTLFPVKEAVGGSEDRFSSSQVETADSDSGTQ